MEKEKKFKKSFFINLSAVILFLAAIVFLTVKYGPTLTKEMSNPDEFRSLILSYGPYSVFVFMFFQIIQVIIAAIPGEVVQIAGGYIFGTFFGTLYSSLGILIGASIVFFLARLLGFPLVKAFVPESKIEKFNFIINSDRSEIAMFVLFLIPGIPKDLLVYIAGLTPIKPLRFFTIFVVGRFPALLASSYVGANLHQKNYTGVIIVSVIACVLFVVGLLKKDAIMNKLHSIMHKKKEEEQADKNPQS